jgi:TctA family transporter
MSPIGRTESAVSSSVLAGSDGTHIHSTIVCLYFVSVLRAVTRQNRAVYTVFLLTTVAVTTFHIQGLVCAHVRDRIPKTFLVMKQDTFWIIHTDREP